jgi:hypothetical protein
MNAPTDFGSLYSWASSIPSRTWFRMIAALVLGLSLSWGLRPRGWFSTKYCGFFSLPMSW